MQVGRAGYHADLLTQQLQVVLIPSLLHPHVPVETLRLLIETGLEISKILLPAQLQTKETFLVTGLVTFVQALQLIDVWF